ncbi:MAG TPA: PIN domain-containing protein [Verrucomicrobiae bacterium]|nr:PIN domain-containing protein [Verrucomicrobiae bacterium]
MPNQKYRVVLDTNQIIGAGSRWLVDARSVSDRNLCQKILIQVAASHTGLYSGKIIGEYLEKLVDLNHPSDRAQRLITYLMGAFSRVQIVTANAPVIPSDPDDEIFILCALDGNADYIVADDKHLLNVKSSYTRPVIGKSIELEPILCA